MSEQSVILLIIGGVLILKTALLVVVLPNNTPKVIYVERIVEVKQSPKEALAIACINVAEELIKNKVNKRDLYRRTQRRSLRL